MCVVTYLYIYIYMCTCITCSCRPGVRDSSGVQLSLSPGLRTYDAETFGLMGGVSPVQRDPLPPGHADYSNCEAIGLAGYRGGGG